MSALEQKKRLPRHIWVKEDGNVRVGWKMAAGVAAYAAVLYGLIAGLGGAFGKLFDAWGLTTSNLAYAPMWAQYIVAWHADFTYAVAYALSALAGLAVARRFTGKATEKHGFPAAIGALTGLGMGAGLTVLALALDSMRLEAPVSEPAFYVAQLAALAVLTLGKFSQEVLTKRVIFDSACAGGRSWPAYVLACGASVLLAGSWNSVPGVVNSALLALLGCVLYVRGGLIASVGLQAAWTAWSSLIFRFPGTAASSEPVYALYHVSEAWLTGGGRGPVCGLWLTTCCLGLLIGLNRKSIRILVTKAVGRKREDGKDQNRNRRNGIKG